VPLLCDPQYQSSFGRERVCNVPELKWGGLLFDRRELPLTAGSWSIIAPPFIRVVGFTEYSVSERSDHAAGLCFQYVPIF
jgi:hypothetical protein